MKDVPHHMNKFIKNLSKEENPKEDTPMKAYRKETPKHQLKKQIKSKKRKEKLKKTPTPDTPETCNKKMKERTPQIRDRSHKTNI
jgi:hypothetical protein